MEQKEAARAALRKLGEYQLGIVQKIAKRPTKNRLDELVSTQSAIECVRKLAE
jgi:hypothetical protein